MHRTQAVAFKINPFIYEIEKQLLAKSEEIGSFRTYEKDTWEDTHKPRINPAVWEQAKWDANHNENKEWEALKQLAGATATRRWQRRPQGPLRVLRFAARFRHAERFFLPTYLEFFFRSITWWTPSPLTALTGRRLS